eukprot:5895055-Amphidinium_carterae.1
MEGCLTIYACDCKTLEASCPMKYESSQQRYIHCGLDHLVYIPMVEGAPQSATNGNELILVQMVKHFNHPTTGVPTYEWRGHEEQKAFWSVLRNAYKQNKTQCQGYVWKRLHADDHVPTLLTPVPVEQQAEFHGERDIRVLRDERIIQTRLPERCTPKYTSNSWHSWRNPNQKGWFGGSSNRKPVSPKAKNKPASAARGSRDRAAPEPGPVIPIPDDVESA